MSLPKKLSVSAIAVALPLISYWEGYSGRAYYDVVGVPTQCYGDTKHVDWTRVKSKEECQKLLEREVIPYVQALEDAIRVPMPDTRKAALTSWTYNVGINAMRKSTLVRKMNAGDIRGACDELLRWNKAGGIAWRGLTNRRMEERELCLRGL